MCRREVLSEKWAANIYSYITVMVINMPTNSLHKYTKSILSVSKAHYELFCTKIKSLAKIKYTVIDRVHLIKLTLLKLKHMYVLLY